jgi:hypothetical protein
MSRRILRCSGIGILVATLAFVGLAVADDPDGPEEPPIRLKKKDKPKKVGDAKKDEAKKDGEAKKPPAGNPVRGEDQRKKLVKRVLKNLRDAEDRLARKDPGKTTRKIQKDILNDLDALIQQTRQQPPPQQRNQSRRQQNRNQRNNPNRPNQPNQSNSQNKPNTSQQANNKNNKPNQGNGQNPNQGGRGGDNKKKDDKNADLYKDAWGHVPEKDRQRIDEYTRAGNIPEYESLQQEYERTLAEEGNR